MRIREKVESKEMVKAALPHRHNGLFTASISCALLVVRPHHQTFGPCSMPRPEIPNLLTWPRNLSTSQGGGLSTSQGGGMSTSQYGGASTSQFGGMSTSQYGGMSTSEYGGLSTSQYGGLSTSQYGGLSTSQYGGLSTSEGGGLSTSAGGGMSTSSSDVYRSNIPPWPVFLRELQTRGFRVQAELIRHYLPEFLWPENFF